MTFNFLKAYLFSKNANSHIKKMAWISMVGITIGSFSLVVVLSIMSGLNRATDKRLLKSEPHLVVKAQGPHESIEAKIKNAGTKDVNYFESQDVLIKTSEGYFSGAEALGLTETSLKKKGSFYDSFKKPLVINLEGFERGDEVFIGPDLAFEMRAVVGDSIEIYKPEAILKSASQNILEDLRTVRIAGVLNSSGEGKEGRALIYSRGKLFTDSLSMEKAYEVYLDEPDQARHYKTVFTKWGHQVETWKERNSALFLALKIEKMSMTLLLGLALLITSFSIMTLLILIVIQKQKDIGILLSMGMSSKGIRKLYSRMGSSLALLGILGGVSLGVLVVLFMDLFPLRILPPIYQDPYLPVEFNFYTFLWIFLFCFLVALLSSLIPVFYVSKITPVSALKETTKL